MAYNLVLPFDTDDVEFTRGVQIGVVWLSLTIDPAEVGAVLYASNAEMVLRMAEATGRSVRSVDLDETWIEVTFGPAFTL